MNESIGRTILDQLGGAGFVMMTGARQLGAIENGMTFRLPRAKSGINYVKIVLNGMDLYDVEFGKVRASTYKVISAHSDVFCEDLQDIFTEATGLYTHL